MPDVTVEESPDQLMRGVDPQLEKAVETVQQDVLAWKKARGIIAQTPAPGQPAPTATVGPGTTVTPAPPLEPKKN